MYPIGPLVGRDTLSTATLGQYKIPAGTTVHLYYQYALRDPRRWDDADVFRPERFLTSYDTTAYLPFGVGPRGCGGCGSCRIFAGFATAFFLYLALTSQQALGRAGCDRPQRAPQASAGTLRVPVVHRHHFPAIPVPAVPGPPPRRQGGVHVLHLAAGQARPVAARAASRLVMLLSRNRSGAPFATRGAPRLAWRGALRSGGGDALKSTKRLGAHSRYVATRMASRLAMPCAER